MFPFPMLISSMIAAENQTRRPRAFAPSPTRVPDDPGRTAEDDALRAGIPTAEQERLRVMKEDDPATQQESPGLLGDRNPRN